MPPFELEYISVKPRPTWWRAAMQYLFGGGMRRIALFSLVPLFTAFCIAVLSQATQTTCYVTSGLDPEYRLQSTLNVMRDQIDLYRRQHQVKAPPQASLMNHLRFCTDADGNISTIGPSPEFPLGPYIQSVPQNCVTGNAAIGAFPAKHIGWVYKVSGSTYTFEAVDESGTHVFPK